MIWYTMIWSDDTIMIPYYMILLQYDVFVRCSDDVILFLMILIFHVIFASSNSSSTQTTQSWLDGWGLKKNLVWQPVRWLRGQKNFVNRQMLEWQTPLSGGKGHGRCSQFAESRVSNSCFSRKTLRRRIIFLVHQEAWFQEICGLCES